MANRYITSGVNSKISLALQMAIWELSESLPCPKDYLQVFRLRSEVENGKAMQVIIQSQEQPEYKNAVSYKCDNPITEKLFMIDDIDHITLLLAEEY